MQIEQIDIDAVNAFHAQSFEALFRSTGPAKRPINEAHRLLVEAFARHRHQARAEVVGEIVAWLREEAAQTRPFDYEIADIWESRADAIEAGEYRNDASTLRNVPVPWATL